MTIKEFKSQFDRNIFEQFWIEEAILVDKNHPDFEKGKLRCDLLKSENKRLDYQYNNMLHIDEPALFNEKQIQLGLVPKSILNEASISTK